jgi:Flp pilus assembly protein TadD
MKDERLIKMQMEAQGETRSRRFLTRPAVTAALTMAVLVLGLLALPGVRENIADNLTSTEAFLYGVTDKTDPNAKSEGKKQNTFKKIVTAPVRLMARIFRGSKSNDVDVAKKSQKDEPKAPEFKAAPVTRTTNGLPGESVVAEPVSASTMAAAADKLFEEAIELHGKGRIDAAVEKLTGALLLNTSNAEIFNMLAVCYDEKGQYKQAQEEYKKALKVSPENPRFLNNLGYSYYLSGDYGNAVKWFSKGLKGTPDDKRLHNNLGLAYGRKGDFTKAREHFALAVGELGANLNLGYVYSQHGKYDDAIKSYEAALQAQPSSLPALSNLAQLYERTGRLREAAALNEQYKKLAVTNQQREQTVDQ